MCNVTLGCITNRQWPYQQTCEELGTEGEFCATDKDCELDNYCWYMSPEDAQGGVKKCM